MLERKGDGVLERVFGERKVAENTDQNRKQASRLLAEEPVERLAGRNCVLAYRD
jgi:hypothetical protein